MIFKYKLFVIIYIFIFIPSQILALENKILFKVNDEIITTLDIYDEIKYINFLNEEFKNFKKDKKYIIAKNAIIKDIIKEIELKKFFKKIELEDKFIEKFAINYFSRFKIDSIDDLELLLKNNDLKLVDIKKKNYNTIDVERTNS